MIIVLVSGGRAYNDRKTVFATLDRIHAEKVIAGILHGACPNRKVNGKTIWSADMLAQAWALDREIAYCGVPAKWKTGKLGKGEGPARNQIMADAQPHYAVFFPGGTGTADMLKRVEAHNIPYEIVYETRYKGTVDPGLA